MEDALGIIDGANCIVHRVLSSVVRVLNRVNDALGILDGANCIIHRVLSSVVGVLNRVGRYFESLETCLA